MDGISLALAVVSLFSTCLDVLENYDDWKDFGDDSSILMARFNSIKLRLKQWGQAVGIEGQTLLESHHKSLDDANTLLIIKKHLAVIQKVYGGERPSLKSKRDRIAWALRDKRKQFSQVEQFGLLVDDLHDIVPPNREFVNDTKQHSGYLARGTTRDSEFDRIISRIEEEIEAETRREVHKWLLGNQSLDESYGRLTKERVEGTCDWIFDRTFFNDWCSSEFKDNSAKLLWVHGPAGFGKSVLCARVMAHLSSTLKTPMACFFFSSDFATRADPFAAIRSWISQVISHPTAYALVKQRWTSQSLPIAARTDIVTILGEIAQAIPECTFILDGLDECTWMEGNQQVSQDTVAGFLEAVFSAVKNSKTRVMVVSRDEPEIRQSLTGKNYCFVEHKISPEDVRPDIVVYARDMVNKKLARKPEIMKLSLSQKMADRSNGQFLWLKFQQESLTAGKNRKQLERVIDETPTQLESVYKRNWIKIYQLPEYDRTRAYSLLRWVAFALRPLTVSEITEAVLIDDGCEDFPVDELPDEIDDDYINTEIIGLCGSLLEVRPSQSDTCARSRTIHLPHFSVKQYLLKIFSAEAQARPISNGLKPSTEIFINDMLAGLCLRYVGFDRVWDDRSLNHETWSFRSYAADTWHKHATISGRVNLEVQYLIQSFFEPNNPNWISWRWWFDRDVPRLENINHGIQDPPAHAIVCYAVRLGLEATVEFLIAERNHDPNEIDLRGETALTVACFEGKLKIVNLLLEKEADFNAANRDTRTPLFLASWKGHENVVKQLFEKGADIHAATNEGMTALHTASWNGHVKVVKYLLEKGADATIQSKDGAPLHEASGHGSVEICKLLLEERADVNIGDKDGWTPLHEASYHGHVGVCKLLLSKYPDIGVKNGHGWTPLHAASYKGSTEAATLLLEAGADMNSGSNDGWTPLHEASFHGHVDTCKVLMEQKAAFITDNMGRTPLYLASERGHRQVVKLLLDSGGDTAISDNDGWVPIMIASQNGHLDVIKLLLKHSADISITDSEGWTPLNIASAHGQLEAVRILLENGPDLINIANNEGWAPVNSASENGNLEVVKLLVENSADLTVTSNDEWTPLHQASMNGYDEVVQVLLESPEVDPDVRDMCDRTPLFFAAREGHLIVVDVLLSKKASPNAQDRYHSTPLFAAVRNGHELVVERLVALPESHVTAQDGFGRTLIWWATKGGHTKIIELVSQHLQKKGIEVPRIEPVVGCSATSFKSPRWCDVCTRDIVSDSCCYQCGVCYDFDICLECFELDAKCLDSSHEWSLCQPEGPKD